MTDWDVDAAAADRDLAAARNPWRTAHNHAILTAAKARDPYARDGIAECYALAVDLYAFRHLPSPATLADLDWAVGHYYRTRTTDRTIEARDLDRLISPIQNARLHDAGDIDVLLDRAGYDPDRPDVLKPAARDLRMLIRNGLDPAPILAIRAAS